MSQHQYVVHLSAQQREDLLHLTRTGTSPAHQQVSARVLLSTDRNQEGEPPTDEQVAQALNISSRTVLGIKARFLQEGLSRALHSAYPRQRPLGRKLDGAAEARLVTLACEQASDGRQRWSLQLLADQMVQLEIVESISKETVRQVLKTTNCVPG